MKIANALIALDSRITTWRTTKNMKYEINIEEFPSSENEGKFCTIVDIVNKSRNDMRRFKSQDYSKLDDFESVGEKLVQLMCVKENLGYCIMQDSFPLDMPVYEKRDDNFVHVGYGRDFEKNVTKIANE